MAKKKKKGPKPKPKPKRPGTHILVQANRRELACRDCQRVCPRRDALRAYRQTYRCPRCGGILDGVGSLENYVPLFRVGFSVIHRHLGPANVVAVHPEKRTAFYTIEPFGNTEQVRCHESALRDDMSLVLTCTLCTRRFSRARRNFNYRRALKRGHSKAQASQFSRCCDHCYRRLRSDPTMRPVNPPKEEDDD